MRFFKEMPAAESGSAVVPVAASLWAVFDSRIRIDAAVGHIDHDGTQFRVGLEGEDLEAYAFDTLDGAAAWFAEFCFALTLGTTPSVPELVPIRHRHAA